MLGIFLTLVLSLSLTRSSPGPTGIPVQGTDMNKIKKV